MKLPMVRVRLIAAGLIVLSAPLNATERKAYVINALAGDMLELVEEGKQYRARIAGIDAPAKDADQAKASKLALSSLTFGRWVQASCVNVAAPPPKKPGAKPKLGPLYCRFDLEGT